MRYLSPLSKLFTDSFIRASPKKESAVFCNNRQYQKISLISELVYVRIYYCIVSYAVVFIILQHKFNIVNCTNINIMLNV